MDLFDFQEETFDESYCPKRLIEFKRYRETMKGNSLNTIKSYTLDIIILLKYLKVKRGLVKKGTDFLKLGEFIQIGIEQSHQLCLNKLETGSCKKTSHVSSS